MYLQQLEIYNQQHNSSLGLHIFPNISATVNIVTILHQSIAHIYGFVQHQSCVAPLQEADSCLIRRQRSLAMVLLIRTMPTWTDYRLNVGIVKLYYTTILQIMCIVSVNSVRDKASNSCTETACA